MRDRGWGTIVAGIVAALLVLAALLAVVGGRDVLDALAAAEPVWVGATAAFGLCWLFAWSLMLWASLGTLGVVVPVRIAFFVYAGAVFANNVTPFGQAGGEPIAALLISRASGARYETGLASITSVDVVNVVASIALVLVGIGYRATTVTVAQRLLTAAASAMVLVGVVVALLAIGWRYRALLAGRVAGTAAAVAARVRPARIDRGAVEAAVAERLSQFFENVEQVGSDRRRLGVLLAFSLAGWCFQGAALYVAFLAVGQSAPAAVLLFVIPLANVAGAAPLPGGLGGVEAAFVALLVPTTGIAAPAVTAAVLVYRGAIYWLPVLIGGGSVTAISVGAVAE